MTTPTTMPAIEPPLTPPCDGVDCGDGMSDPEVVTGVATLFEVVTGVATLFDVVVPVGDAEVIELEASLVQL